MAIGVVRGRFELDAPALRVLKDLERQGYRSQASIDRLAASIDKVGDASDTTRIRRVSAATTKVGTDTRQAARTVDSGWRRMSATVERETNRQVRSLERFALRLDELAAKQAKPTVEIDGLAKALADVELLSKRLDALNGKRATPRVAVGGGRMTPDGPGLPGGGGGGGGGGAVKSVGLGALNLGGGAGLATIGALLPIAQMLGGTAVAGGASLLGAAGGAGALGLTGGVGMAAGLAGVISVAKPAMAAIKETTKAQEAYNKALAEYGKNSDQARVAKAALDAQMKVAPQGTRQLLRESKALSEEWKKATRPGQDSLMRLGIGTLQKTRRFAGGAGADAANRVTGAVEREGSRFGSFATGTQGRRGARLGAGIFDQNLGNFRKATQYGLETVLNISQAARPFFKDATDWMVRWTRGWATSTRDIDATRGRIGGMVDNLREWKDLTGATFGLMKSLYSTGNDAGDSAVSRLTAQLDTWSAWIDRNPAKVRKFFDDAVDDTARLGRGVMAIVEALNGMATTLRPLVNGFSSLAEGAGALGLLTPGAGALAFGAYKGLRRGAGGVGPGGPGGGAGGPGVVPVGGGGGGGGRGGIAGAARQGYRRSSFNAAYRGWGVADQRIAGGIGAARGGAGAAGRLGGAALMGAGRAFLPVGVALAALGAAGTEGGVGRKIQGGLGMGTLGLLGGVTTDATIADRASQNAASFGDRLGADPTTLGGGIKRAKAYDREIARLSAPKQGLYGFQNAIAGDDGKILGIKASGGVSKDVLRENAARVKILKAERDALREANSQALVARQRRERGADAARGVKVAGQYERGFEKNTQGKGPKAIQDEFRRVRKGVMDDMGKLKRDGAQSLAKSTVAWAAEAAKANPALRGQYAKMRRSVEAQFRRMGMNVKVVNGQILDGSSAQWNRTATAISGAAREGVDKTGAEFRRLRRMALAQLKLAGFSEKEAEGVFKLQSSGNSKTRDQAAGVVKSGPGSYNARIASGDAAGPITPGSKIAKARGGRFATGGRFGGSGLGDTINARVAPGEIILNRHQEGDLNRDLQMAGKPPLETYTKRNMRKHGEAPRGPARPHARGGAAAAAGGGMNLKGASQSLAPYARDAAGYGLTVTSGMRPGSITSAGNVSNHSRGLAIDLGGPPAAMMSFARHAASAYGSRLEELIYSPMGFSIKNGARVAPYAVADHYDHVHLADTNAGGGGLPGGAVGAMGGAMGGAGMGGVEIKALKARKIKAKGAVGAMGQRSADLIANALTEKMQAAAGAMGGGAPTGAGGAAPKGNVRAWLAAALRHTGHYSEANLNALYGRAMQESGGNPNAVNNWDSNAKAGYPSRGLLQTIPQTFNAYRDPSIPGGITDPIANSVAAIRYMFSRYGHIVGSNGRGYAAGGRIAGGGGCSICGGSHETFQHGGRAGGKARPFAGSFRNGGKFTTKAGGKGAFFEAGEGGSAETITVEPRRPRRRKANGPASGSGTVSASAGGISVAVNIATVQMSSGADVAALSDRLANEVGKKILAAIRGDDEGLMSDG